jgi:hypothetical protein
LDQSNLVFLVFLPVLFSVANFQQWKLEESGIDGSKVGRVEPQEVDAFHRNFRPGIDPTKLSFGRKFCGFIFILKFWTNFHPKSNT